MGFLDSLATEGGKLAILVCLLLWVGTLAVVLHSHLQENGRIILSNAFTALFTAIIMKLQDGKKV